VVTGLFPLAQAAEQVGGTDVHVVDVVPAGRNPLTYRLTGAQVAATRRAAVVVVAGGGFQLSLEQAASGNRGRLDLRTDLGTDDPYVWLNLALMHRAISAIANTLATADPAAGGSFRRNATAYIAEVDSTGIDYQSTLSVCPRHTIVTADGAFQGMARTYGLVDRVVGPTGAADASAATAAGVTTAFAEPFVPAAPVDALAAAAHLKVRTLDPLTGAPPGGWPRGADYIRLMEADLGALNSALGCPDTSTGT
jgi:ABC-type Zn uptake system ZnuABC Zn-binding protein ZnuA